MVVVCGDRGGEVSWWDDVHGSYFPDPFFSFLFLGLRGNFCISVSLVSPVQY